MSAIYRTSSVTNLAGASSCVINKPSGVVDGDLMVAVINSTFNSGSQTMTPPAGWTQIRNTDAGGGGASLNIWSYYKVANGEGASYTWGIGGGIPGAHGGCIMRIDGQAASPILTSAGAGTNGAATSSLTFANTVTPTNGYQLILMPIFATGASLSSMSAHAVATSNPTWTELYDNSSVANYNMSLAYATRDQSTATGNSSATASNNCSSFAGQQIVVDRIYSFSGTFTETLTCTDLVTNNVGFKNTYTETLTLTDEVETQKTKTWIAQPKSPPPDWHNRPKS